MQFAPHELSSIEWDDTDKCYIVTSINAKTGKVEIRKIAEDDIQFIIIYNHKGEVDK